MTDADTIQRIRNYCEEMIPVARSENSECGDGMALGLSSVLEIVDADKRPALKEKTCAP